MSPVLTGEQAELAASPSRGMSSGWWRGPTDPEEPRLPIMSPNRPWETGLPPPRFLHLPCPAPAKQLLDLSSPKTSQDSHTLRQVQRKTPRGTPRPRAPDSYIQLHLFGQMGQRKGGHYPCTWILPLAGHHQAPEASLFLCPHFPGGLWGLTKHPGEEAIKPQTTPHTQVLWPVPSTLLRRSQTEQATPSQPRNTPSVGLGGACSSTFGSPKPSVLLARPCRPLPRPPPAMPQACLSAPASPPASHTTQRL